MHRFQGAIVNFYRQQKTLELNEFKGLCTTVDHSRFEFGVPTGIRTPVTAVKGRCPRPLDDRDFLRWVYIRALSPNCQEGGVIVCSKYSKTVLLSFAYRIKQSELLYHQTQYRLGYMLLLKLFDQT